MKLGSEQWDEWFSAPVTDEVSAESELAGIMACMNVKQERGKVRAVSTRLWVYRRFRRLWPLVSWANEKDLSEVLRFRSRKVTIELPPELYRKVLSKPSHRDFIRWPWARGVFGCTGSIYNPRRGYYCIMRIHNSAVSDSVHELLEGCGIISSQRMKDGVTEITIRDLQQIMRFCYFIGLPQTAQALEERSMLRSGRDLANKQANCDSANIRRSVETSRQYSAVIQYLMKLDGRMIPEKLRPLAAARLENPEATLAELGSILRPQVSKSTVKYRLKKLQKIAEEAGFDLSKRL